MGILTARFRLTKAEPCFIAGRWALKVSLICQLCPYLPTLDEEQHFPSYPDSASGEHVLLICLPNSSFDASDMYRVPCSSFRHMT